MTRQLCSIQDCGRPVQGHGLCSMHYMRARRHGDPLRTSNRGRPRKYATKTRICEHCGGEFLFERGGNPGPGKYCSRSCSNRAFKPGRGLRGKDHPNWKGGCIQDGYRVVHSDRKDGKRKLVFEHRLVMEQNLGRELLSTETVHHRNGDKLDNRIENLELWASRHPRGQRVVEIESD